MRITSLLIATAIIATPAFAQSQTTPPAAGSESPDAPRTPLPYDRGYDKDSPRTEAINESSRADVAAANTAVRDSSAAQPTTGVLPADQEQYAADMTAYRAAMREQRRDERFAARQERAYADAMADWRVQVADCRRGVKAACRAPSPRPADYF